MKQKPIKTPKDRSLYYLGAAMVVGAFAVGLSETGKHGPVGAAVPIKPVAEHEKVPAKQIVKGAAPKIVALGAKHNFGKVKEGSQVVHVFKVRNGGKADLVIEKAQGS